jgi:RNA polymerase sigma-70 factor (ECF subfamily)
MNDETRKQFCDLYQNYHFYIFKRLQYFVGGQELARDLTQEVFYKVVVELEKGNREVLNIRYLTRLATNLCIDHLRKARFEVPVDTAWLNGTSAGDSPAQADRMLLVHQMLGRLSRANREIAIYRLVDGYGLDEISAITRIPKRSLQRRLDRIKKRLRAWLS